MNGPNNVTIFNTDISEFPTSLICDRLNQLSKDPDFKAMGDNEILSEAAKRLDNLHNAHLHHPDCAYWAWDWKNSWAETDCTCDSVGELWNDLECAVANAQAWKDAAEKTQFLLALKNEHLDEVISDLKTAKKVEAKLAAIENKIAKSIDWSIAHVPKEYTNRGLSDKYLRGDNAAGGAYELATEIQDIIKCD